MKNSTHTKKIFFLLLLGALTTPSFMSASTTSGTIDSVNKYAKGLEEDIGRINFGTTNGNVTVTDSAITGYAWSEVFGWINLAPTNSGVTNNGEGTLSGYAWGENTGWINFKPTNGGVTINSSGDFLGYAWGENIGWIIFNCATNSSCATEDFKVSTYWRPRSARSACNNATDDDGDGKSDYPDDAGCTSLSDTNETGPSGGGGGGRATQPPLNISTIPNTTLSITASNNHSPQENNTDIRNAVSNEMPRSEVQTGAPSGGGKGSGEDVQNTQNIKKGNDFAKATLLFINNGMSTITKSIHFAVKKITTYTSTKISWFYSLVIKLSKSFLSIFGT